ncbi:hypothetical protein LEAN103870_10610 [Legionella anisa]|uniref:Uncharacterized protein n=1 Tax=Legionella anisa TaxID=28082 RepID=A0AAX0WS91_9GAMM|nr:hypothetical protein [Legionella anisa]AWN74830.1 hypothetical protein DLD14_13845 [Legionella anisa]KTC77699.1 hypothetical protein Lani_0257 [Legionella anisa]MBN5937602.1 hypothetical protein [Legionella anisa]MCW8424972.1 hypothetical protein [Legionella anisa]MCW8445908.1 hypothetical protein [Legionella anisa]
MSRAKHDNSETLPQPNYKERPSVPDPTNPGYVMLRSHAMNGGGRTPTFFGSSTPNPDAGITRISRSIYDPASQQELSEKLDTIARNQQIKEALNEIVPEMPDGVIHIIGSKI